LVQGVTVVKQLGATVSVEVVKDGVQYKAGCHAWM